MIDPKVEKAALEKQDQPGDQSTKSATRPPLDQAERSEPPVQRSPTPIFSVTLKNRSKETETLVSIFVEAEEDYPVVEQGAGSDNPPSLRSQALLPANRYKITIPYCDAGTAGCHNAENLDPPLALIYNDPLRFQIELLRDTEEDSDSKIWKAEIVFVFASGREVRTRPLVFRM